MSISAAVSGQYHHIYQSRPAAAQDQSAGDGGTAATRDAVDASGATAAGAAFAALLGRIGAEGGVAAAPAAATSNDSGTAIKPNLDALNRVLNHYRAQSEALNTAISLD